MSKHTNNNYKAYVNADGNRVMRVTDVIKVMAKDQLILWANMLGFKNISYKKELERTANIGSLVHSVLEAYHSPNLLAEIDYDEFNISDYGDKLEVRHALDSFFAWYENTSNHHPFKVAFTELVVVGKQLGGTIDCGIQGWKDPDKFIFVDYKTSKGFYLTQFLQLAAYAMLYEEVYGKKTVEGIMVIIMDKKYGNPAQARFISRKNLDLFIDCFQYMFCLAASSRYLEGSLPSLSEYIS